MCSPGTPEANLGGSAPPNIAYDHTRRPRAARVPAGDRRPMLARRTNPTNEESNLSSFTAKWRRQGLNLHPLVRGTTGGAQYSCVLVTPGVGTGYFPSLSPFKGAGDSAVSLSRPGANSCLQLSMSLKVISWPV